MCGRYVLFSDPELQEIREIIEEMQSRNETFKTGEIFPTDRAPVLIQKNSNITPEVLAWGFPNFRNKGVIINARAETVPVKPLFRNCLLTRRCVIPSTGFFEWSHNGRKTKYRFNLPGTGVLYMAGLYDEFQGKRRFTIITTTANQSMADIHNRMPVVLDSNAKDHWLKDPKAAMKLLSEVPPQLVREPA